MLFNGKYKLVVATKGDLLDQRRKLHNSGLGHYFHHIEVMSDKQEVDYSDLIKRLKYNLKFFHDWKFLKSDVTCFSHWRTCCSYSFHTTWARKIDHKVEHENFSAF
jgi:putative hydrolase of the HAD superfamily